ncbi:MAG: hypothetical protein IJ540_03245 [Prevotella sp.]|nr:hypothetical protein [Prevotella sp.]
MMMEENKKAPIDFTDIYKRLKPHKKKYYYVMGITLIATYLLMVCIPRYYISEVSLAPEPTGPSVGGSLESLASSFGLGGMLSKMGSQDAIYAEIYPEVVSSKNFIADLMTVQVKTKNGNIKCDYYTYMSDHQKEPWWGFIFEGISKLFDTTPDNVPDKKEGVSVFNHTKKQDAVFSRIEKNIRCRYDKKTDIVHVVVTDQDPLVSAIMAEATCQKLQEFIVKYRTNKARIDYEHYKTLRDKARADYDKAMQLYSVYADGHSNAVRSSSLTKAESLENEMEANWNLYSVLNNQVQTAEAKLQEATPAFTIIEDASIPLKPAGPKRTIIAILMSILSFFVLSGFLLIKKKA